jgi:hypothetical protein
MNTLVAALDFELPHNQQGNLVRAGLVNRRRSKLTRSTPYYFYCGFFGEDSARAGFVIPFADVQAEGLAVATKAVKTMVELINQSYDLFT